METSKKFKGTFLYQLDGLTVDTSAVKFCLKVILLTGDVGNALSNK